MSTSEHLSAYMPDFATKLRCRVVGATWGPPFAEATYRGIPARLFRELEADGVLAGAVNNKLLRWTDVFRGVIGWRRSISERHPCVNPLWRYMPEATECLSRRCARLLRRMPQHDVVLQFGVAGLPSGVPLVAHVEMSVLTASSSNVYARAYGFAGWTDKHLERAIAGERYFLKHCTLIWTNTEWTARGLLSQGVPRERIRVCPPGCGVSDPGPIDRDWSRLNILFVGRDWEGKGGPLLLDAFRIVRTHVRRATLTIIGCNPRISEPGVHVCGYLDKDRPEHLQQIQDAYRTATAFCLPTLFDTTGVVFQEAGIYGIPIVMLIGQGRENLFPADMAIHIREPDSEELATALTQLAASPERMKHMGTRGRERVLECHTWGVVQKRVRDFLFEASHGTSPAASASVPVCIPHGFDK